MGLTEDLARGKLADITVVVAENPYVLWDLTRKWKAAWTKQTAAGSKDGAGAGAGATTAAAMVDRFMAPQINFDEFCNAVQTGSLFAETRLVILQNADKVPAALRDRYLTVLNAAAPGTKILITSESADLRTKFFKSLKALGSFEAFPRIYDNQLSGWVSGIAADVNVRLSPDAVQFLADNLGHDLFAVRQTLEKVSLFLGPEQDRRIEQADVELALAGVGDHSIFLYLDLLGTGETARAHRMLGAMMAGEKYPIRWIGTIIGHLRKLLFFLQEPLKSPLSRERKDQDDRLIREAVVQRIAPAPFLARKFLNQAVFYGRESILNGISLLFELEWAVKTSRIEGTLALELATLLLGRRVFHNRLREFVMQIGSGAA